MIVRFATPEDEEFLSGFIDFGDLDLDWTGASGSWLVVEKDNEIIGAVQFALSKPIGHIEFMTVKDDLSSRDKFKVSLLLGDAALKCLQADGTTNIRVMVEFENKTMKKLLKKYFHGHVINQGNLMLVRAGQ